MLPEQTDREDLREQLLADALASYDQREQDFGDEIMRQLERAILMQIIDNRWREHLYEMDYLREGIHLRGFAQIDPLVAYKNEGFSMFEALMHSIWEEFARLIFHVEVEVAPRAQEEFAPAQQPLQVDYSGGTAEQPSALGQAAVATASGPDAAAEQELERQAGNGGGAIPEQETVVKDEKEKIGRNDPCWCGSGKKYKKCHGA
jgi:preprotein translocase subunit SecA